MPNEIERVSVLGVPVCALTMDGILGRMEELLARPGCAAAYAVNAHSLNLTYRHRDYLAALRRAEIVYADGASVLLAAKVLGKRLPEKLTTTDVWPYFCRRAEEKGYSFFLLGGEEGLAARAAETATKEYPKLKIAGTRNGFFDFADRSVVETINAARPDVLWVGMGDPRQALWVEAVRTELNAGLAVTCGGMFKIVTGQIERVDEKWRRRGLEWFFRLLQEPKYTWRRYLLGLPAFGFRLLAQRLFGHRRKLPPREDGG